MASIRKHRDKYQVRIRRTGMPTIAKSFHRLSDAKEWATLQERKADRGELGHDRKELERITLTELVTRYLNEIVPAKKGARIETIILNAFLRHRICKKRLSDLTTADFATYRDERLKIVAPQTLKRQLAPISNMFEIAITEWKIPLGQNPLSTLALKVTASRRQRRLREGEFERLLEAGKKTRNPLILPIIMFALETAMRRGEILALRLHDIDLERHSVIIRESKNGHSRTIPLSSTAASILNRAIGRMDKDEKGNNGRLFPLTPVALRLAWDRMTKRAEIEDLNFHDLRHEAISRLFELGLTVPEVASVSGHRDMRMLFRYAHANHVNIRAKLEASILPMCQETPATQSSK